VNEDLIQKRTKLIEQAYGRLPDSDDLDRRAAWREGINAVLSVIGASRVVPSSTTGVNHYREAERLLPESSFRSSPTGGHPVNRQGEPLSVEHRDWMVAAAGVHATLATKSIPDNVVRAFESMKSAVLHGVTWDGTPESISGVTTGEVLNIVSDFITTFDEWRGGAA
jgi:hypothetical protein